MVELLENINSARFLLDLFKGFTIIFFKKLFPYYFFLGINNKKVFIIIHGFLEWHG